MCQQTISGKLWKFKNILQKTENGLNPYKKWSDSLDSQARIRVLRQLRKLEFGNTSIIKWLGGGVGELKIDWGSGYRIYVAKGGTQLIILFGGGTKKNQQADIDKARELYQEYKQQKKKTKKSQE